MRPGARAAGNPADILLTWARDAPDRTALVAGNEAWTYRRLADAAETLAAALRSRGTRPGDRVALHMTNVPELAVAYFGCFLAGAIAVPLNVRLRTAELAALLRQVGPALYLGQAELYAHVAPVEAAVLAPSARFVVDAPLGGGAASWASLLAGGNGSTRIAHASGCDDPAVLLATSGTTGPSKLVIHTPATLSAIAESFTSLRLGGEDTALVMLPMVHGAAFTILFACVRFGAPAVLVERFDPGAALDAIQHHRCTWTMGVPFMFSDMLQRQREKPRDVAALQHCLVVGDVCPVRLQEAFPPAFETRRFDQGGPALIISDPMIPEDNARCDPAPRRRGDHRSMHPCQAGALATAPSPSSLSPVTS